MGEAGHEQSGDCAEGRWGLTQESLCSSSLSVPVATRIAVQAQRRGSLCCPSAFLGCNQWEGHFLFLTKLIQLSGGGMSMQQWTVLGYCSSLFCISSAHITRGCSVGDASQLVLFSSSMLLSPLYSHAAGTQLGTSEPPV